jgi:hypothetical protein
MHGRLFPIRKARRVLLPGGQRDAKTVMLIQIRKPSSDTDIRLVWAEENDHSFHLLNTEIFLSSSSLADMSPSARVGFLKRLPLLSGPNVAASPWITAVSTPPYHGRTDADPELGSVVGLLEVRTALHALAGTPRCSADL